MKSIKIIYKIIGVFLVSFVCSLSPLMAESQNKDSALALQQTLELLQNRQAIEAMGKSNGAAKTADQKAKNLTGGGQSLDEIYAITAEIFKHQVKAGKASPQELEDWMLKAQSNPKAFFDNLTPEQKAAISSLAGQIGNARNPSSPK